MVKRGSKRASESDVFLRSKPFFLEGNTSQIHSAVLIGVSSELSHLKPRGFGSSSNRTNSPLSVDRRIDSKVAVFQVRFSIRSA